MANTEDNYDYSSYPDYNDESAPNDTHLVYDYKVDEGDDASYPDVGGVQLNETFSVTHNESVLLSNSSSGSASTTTSADLPSDIASDGPAVSTESPSGTQNPPIHVGPTSYTSFVPPVVVTLACPDRCRCLDGATEFINCSALSLTQIPHPLPPNVLQLDLSHNRIATIAPATFAQTPQLRRLLLHHNNLTAITATDFAGAQRLDHVDLHANQIRHIAADAFADAAGLSNLSLAHNPLQLDEQSGALLNAPDLHTLDLEACGLTDVYNATFRQLTGLVALNLRANRFADDWNVAAFANMSQLAQLRLSELPRARMAELCNLASVIDVISGDQYDLSCFELMSGQTYDESTNTPAPPMGAGRKVAGEWLRDEQC